MDKIKNNLTSNIIAVIISLMTIVTVFSGFISNQAKLEVQLTGIQKELVEIKIAIKEDREKTDAKIDKLTDRVYNLEKVVN